MQEGAAGFPRSSAEEMSFGVTIAAVTRSSEFASVNESLTAEGLAPLKNWQWKAVVEQKAHRGRLWKMLGKDQLLKGMWVYLSLERASEKVSEGC